MNRRQTIPKHLRYTINDFNSQFPNDDACLEHLKEQRFPGGITYCETCQKDRKHHRITGRPVYSCDHCGTQISPMAGTIFQHSSTSLRLWYYAMYLMASTRCGISAKQIQRETGVTYKTAWRMFKQIRSMLQESEPIGGKSRMVETDEMYHGGKRKQGTGRRLRNDKGETLKSPVLGMVERKGRIRAIAIADVKSATLLENMREYILPATTVFTDDLASYDGLTRMQGQGYKHHRINHSAKVYVQGTVHTNTIEGFWSLVKRGIGGVYHQVSHKYLQTYLDEYSFRYNRRFDSQPMFTSFLKQVEKHDAVVRQSVAVVDPF
jgi:transposase